MGSTFPRCLVLPQGSHRNTLRAAYVLILFRKSITFFISNLQLKICQLENWRCLLKTILCSLRLVLSRLRCPGYLASLQEKLMVRQCAIFANGWESTISCPLRKQCFHLTLALPWACGSTFPCCWGIWHSLTSCELKPMQ